jgi:hypothetical protein
MFDLVADLPVIQDDIMQHLNDIYGDDEPDWDLDREERRLERAWA